MEEHYYSFSLLSLWLWVLTYLNRQVDILRSMGYFALTRRLAKAVRQREENLHRDRMEFLPTRTVRSGYNCRGFVYLGRTDHPWEAVFDTGSTRNAVSLEFLK